MKAIHPAQSYFVNPLGLFLTLSPPFHLGPCQTFCGSHTHTHTILHEYDADNNVSSNWLRYPPWCVVYEKLQNILCYMAQLDKLNASFLVIILSLSLSLNIKGV